MKKKEIKTQNERNKVAYKKKLEFNLKIKL